MLEGDEVEVFLSEESLKHLGADTSSSSEKSPGSARREVSDQKKDFIKDLSKNLSKNPSLPRFCEKLVRIYEEGGGR